MFDRLGLSKLSATAPPKFRCGLMLDDLPAEVKAAFQRVRDTLAVVQEARQNAKTCAQLFRLDDGTAGLIRRAEDCSLAQALWERASKDYEDANVDLLRMLGLGNPSTRG